MEANVRCLYGRKKETLMGGLATVLPLVFVLWQNAYPHQIKYHIFDLLILRRKKVAPMVGWALESV